MATTSFGVNNALAVKLWSKKLAVEALKDCYLGKFTGSGSDSLIQVKTETQKSAGDKITFGLRMQLSGAGIQGDSTLEGSEEALTTYSDAVILDQLRHAVRSGGKMSEQRVPFSVREEAYAGLKDWWMDRFDVSFFNQAAGKSGVTDSRYTGNNTAVVPTATTNHIFCSSDHTTDETLDNAGDEFSLVHLDKAVALAKTNSPMIRPIRTNGGEYYVCFIHPGQTLQLRTTTTTGYWQDIQKAALMGGNQKDNPLFTGALGVYNGVILHESTRVPKGQNSTTLAEVANTRRAILCGAQAATMAFGQGGGENKFSWTEELFDYENQLGVAAGSIFGLKKTIFNSKDFGTIVMSTYSLY
jgi:N4-gp56 family major capsid protein